MAEKRTRLVEASFSSGLRHTLQAMTLGQLMKWIAARGIVLESAQGRVPNVAEHIAGEKISGSWWKHPESREIFRLTREVRDAEEILVARLVDGKVTFVHRRVWPALVRLASRFPRAALARIVEEHTESGKHVVRKTPFPKWVPPDVQREAERMTVEEAEKLLGALLTL